MKSEIFFEKKNYISSQITVLTVFLILEVLSFSKSVEYYENSEYISLAIMQLLFTATTVPIFWKLKNNNALRFYEEGVSYINIFTEEFLTWNEVREVKIYETPLGCIFELIAEDKKVQISAIWFKNSDNVIDLLNKKLEKCFY